MIRFNKETLEILQNFAQINTGMQFRKGKKQTTVSTGRGIIGISHIDTDIPKSFAIYELSKFLGILSLFNDPEIELGDEYATIKNDNGQKVDYRYCEPRMITSWPEDKKEDLQTVDSSFELTKETWTKLNKSSNLLTGKHIRVQANGSDIQIKTFDEEDKMASTASFVVGNSDITYDIYFQTAVLNILPGNYLIEICKNKLTRWTNKDKNVVYYIPAERKLSTFE
jgi:hypothetical protein